MHGHMNVKLISIVLYTCCSMQHVTQHYILCPCFLLLLQLLHVPPTDENIVCGSLGSYQITAISHNDWSVGGCFHCIAEMGRSYDMLHIHSCQQKSISLKFSKSQTGSDVRYSCHHNSSRFTFPIFAHSCRFSGLHSLQSITPRIY